MKKKLAFLLVFVLTVGLFAVNAVSDHTVYAKTAQMYMEFPDTIKKEDTFQMKIVLDSDVELYSVDAYLSYDAEKLEFIPETEAVTGTAGILELKDTYPEETKNIVYTISFKALETGETEIGLNDISLIDYADMDYIEVASSSQMLDIGINKKVEMDSSLADLIVAPGDLTEEFSPDQTEYEMHVPLDVELIGVTAIPAEEDSVVELDMPDKLKVGENVITITVTALSGNVQSYKITVYREEIEDTEDTEEEATEEETTALSSEEESGFETAPTEEATVSDTEEDTTQDDLEPDERITENTDSAEETEDQQETLQNTEE